MRRMLLTYLVIGLLLAGCTVPETQENDFLLFPVTFQVTPRPGWTVTYQLHFDILFQRPLEWQEGESVSGFDFEGPNGTYINFSDTPMMPASFNDAVEKTCQKEIEDAANMEKKLGSKPYGENPQLISLQVDQQPACLILPSTDQNEQFQKRAFLIIEYPKNLSLESGTPRYLSVLADSGHIQSLAETIRFIPRPDQPVEALPQATAFAPTLSGNLTLKNQNVLSIMLDDTHIYWTVNEQQDTIFRAPLSGGAVEKIVTSKDKDGSVITIPPVREGDWLIYLDYAGLPESANWELRAKNLRDGSEQVVLKGSGNQAYAFGLNISADNDWVAWSRTVPNAQGTCDESILGLSNLRTGEQVELDRVCTDQYMWSIVSLSNQTLVAEQDFPDAKGGGSALYLFDDFHNRHHKALTTDGRVSMPRVSYSWIVWKNALRFSWGYSNSIYDLGNKTQRAVMVPGEASPDPKLAGQWLYWVIRNSGTEMGGIYLYDLKREQVWNIPAPREGILSTAAIHGHWIAWNRISDFSAGGEEVLEWGVLP